MATQTQDEYSTPIPAGATSTPPGIGQSKVVIPTPLSNGTTDVANIGGTPVTFGGGATPAGVSVDVRPPVDEYSTPIPAGATSTPPANVTPWERSEAYKQKAWAQTWKDLKAFDLHNAAHDVATLFQNPDEPLDFTTGVAKGAGQTVNAVSTVLNKIPVVGETLAPSAGIKAAGQMETPTNSTQSIGVGLESLAEFMMGDEAAAALIPLSYAQKMAKLLPYMRQLEDSPKLLRMVKYGYEAAKASAVSATLSAAHAPTGERVAAAKTGALYGLGGATVGEGLGWGADAYKALTPEARAALAEAKATQSEAVRIANETQQYRIDTPKKLSNVAHDAFENATGVSNAPTVPAGVDPDIAPAGTPRTVSGNPVPVTPADVETAQKAQEYARKTLDYTFGDASEDIKTHYNPVYNQLRESTGGVLDPSTGRYGANAFDDAVTQIKRAKKVIYSPSPASVDSLRAAESELADGQAKLNEMFTSNPTAYAEAQAGWRKASVLEDLDNTVSKALEPSKGLREVSGRMPTVDPEKLVARIDKSFDDVGPDQLRNALGDKGAEDLMGVHRELKSTLNSEDATEALQRAAKQILRENPSPQGKGSMGFYAGESLVAILSHFATAGSHDPLVAGGLGAAAVLRYLYTHPAQGMKILRFGSAIAPAAAQGLKLSQIDPKTAADTALKLYQYDPKTGTVGPTPTTTPTDQQ